MVIGLSCEPNEVIRIDCHHMKYPSPCQDWANGAQPGLRHCLAFIVISDRLERILRISKDLI